MDNELEVFIGIPDVLNIGRVDLVVVEGERVPGNQVLAVAVGGLEMRRAIPALTCLVFGDFGLFQKEGGEPLPRQLLHPDDIRQVFLVAERYDYLSHSCSSSTSDSTALSFSKLCPT